MKPFNLQEALAGKPVVIGDGRTVENICHLPKAGYPGHRVAGVVGGELYTWQENGVGRNGMSNLFMAPVKVTMWVNMYETGDRAFRPSPTTHNTRDQAVCNKSAACGQYIGTYPIEIEL